MIWVLLCLLVLGVAAAPYAAERRRLVMDDTARADAPGAFIYLKHGRTHYRYFGPQSSPLAVCVHGLTTPSFVFEALADGLVAKGYRVLVAPAGMGHELGPLAKFIRVMPGIGDWLFMVGYGRSHRKGTEKERALHSAVPFVVDRQQRELQYRGFLPSVLSSLRNGLRAQAKADHQSIHDAGTKAVAI